MDRDQDQGLYLDDKVRERPCAGGNEQRALHPSDKIENQAVDLHYYPPWLIRRREKREREKYIFNSCQVKTYNGIYVVMLEIM